MKFIGFKSEVIAMAASETRTLDRVKRKMFMRRGIWEVGKMRERASSIDSLYTGTKVKNIPEFSLRVVSRNNTGTIIIIYFNKNFLKWLFVKNLIYNTCTCTCIIQIHAAYLTMHV